VKFEWAGISTPCLHEGRWAKDRPEKEIKKVNNNDMEELSSATVTIKDVDDLEPSINVMRTECPPVTTITIKDVDLEGARGVVEAICIATNPDYLPLIEVEYDADAKAITLYRIPTWIEVYARLAAELYDAPLWMWFQRLHFVEVVDDGDLDVDLPYEHVEAMYHRELGGIQPRHG
jgi:hypothetical protein